MAGPELALICLITGDGEVFLLPLPCTELWYLSSVVWCSATQGEESGKLCPKSGRKPCSTGASCSPIDTHWHSWSSNTGVAIVCQIYVSNSDFLYLNYYQLEEVAFSYILSALYLSRMTITIVNGLILKHWHYQQVVRWSIPLLTLLTGFTFLLDWYGDAMVGFNLVMPMLCSHCRDLWLPMPWRVFCKITQPGLCRATALLFVVFSAIASVINGLLMVFHDGTPKMLSLFSLVTLLTTWILYLVIRPGTSHDHHHCLR